LLPLPGATFRKKHKRGLDGFFAGAFQNIALIRIHIRLAW
jgi:hypothetical protein